jgi:hypothetical protein
VSDNPEKPHKYQIPAGNPGVQTIIKPGGKLIIWADKLESENLVFTYTPLNVVREGIYFSNIHSGFKLSNDEEKEQEVIITSSEEFIANNQAYFDQHPALKYFADHIVYKAHKGDQTVGRFPDGGNSLYVMNRPTIGQNNLLHTYDEFIGMDDGVIVDNPELAINTPVAESKDITVKFAEGNLVLQAATEGTAQLYIYSSTGQLLKSQTVNFTTGTTTVDLNNLPTGIYMATVKESNTKAAGCKFMVK